MRFSALQKPFVICSKVDRLLLPGSLSLADIGSDDLVKGSKEGNRQHHAKDSGNAATDNDRGKDPDAW